MSTRYSQTTTPLTINVSMDNLANGAVTAQSPDIDNTSANKRLLMADFHLVLGGQGGTRVGSATVLLYVVPFVSVSGVVNYPSIAGECLYNYLASTVRLDKSNTGRTVVFQNVRIPPTNFFVVIENRTGQFLSASGNSLTMTTYSYENVN